MVNMTLSIPKEIKNKMEVFPEINWSEVARQAFKKKLSDLELLEKIKSESTLDEEEAIRLGRELNKKMAEKYSK